ncbi:hypothetical protein COP2_027075 [Malus domestica]
MYILFKILHSLSFSAGLYDCHLMIQKALTRLMTEPFMNPPSIYSPLWESQLSIGTRQYTFVQGCVSSHCVHVLSTHTVLSDQFYGSDNETCVGTLVMGRTGFASEELRIVGC